MYIIYTGYEILTSVIVDASMAQLVFSPWALAPIAL